MPDTFAYYVAAYVASGILCAGYVASLWYRARLAARHAAMAAGAREFAG